MADEKTTERAKDQGENSETRRQNDPSRDEPTYYRKELERSGWSEWSGGWASGRSRER